MSAKTTWFQEPAKGLGVADPEYHPELWGKSVDCKESRKTVDLTRMLSEQILAVHDDTSLTRAQVIQRLNEIAADYTRLLRQSGPSTILEDF